MHGVYGRVGVGYVAVYMVCVCGCVIRHVTHQAHIRLVRNLVTERSRTARARSTLRPGRPRESLVIGGYRLRNQYIVC